MATILPLRPSTICQDRPALLFAFAWMSVFRDDRYGLLLFAVYWRRHTQHGIKYYQYQHPTIHSYDGLVACTADVRQRYLLNPERSDRGCRHWDIQSSASRHVDLVVRVSRRRWSTDSGQDDDSRRDAWSSPVCRQPCNYGGESLQGCNQSWTWIGFIHPWIGLGWVGLDWVQFLV